MNQCIQCGWYHLKHCSFQTTITQSITIKTDTATWFDKARNGDRQAAHLLLCTSHCRHFREQFQNNFRQLTRQEWRAITATHLPTENGCGYYHTNTHTCSEMRYELHWYLRCTSSFASDNWDKLQAIGAHLIIYHLRKQGTRHNGGGQSGRGCNDAGTTA